MRYLYVLLIFVPISIIVWFLHGNPLLQFAAAALGVIPLAGVLGKSTEELAAHTGPKVGGLLNATLGNAAELIITIFAIREGLLELVKASITGSILGNVLLILGLSLLAGGLRHGKQRFDRDQASTSATMMALAIMALVIPAVFALGLGNRFPERVEFLSLGVAAAMIVIYILSLVYSLFFSNNLVQAVEVHSTWSIRKALVILVVATVFIAWLSEILVVAVEPVVASLGISEFFLGIVIIPLVGNVAEHLVGVQTALKNKMDLSLSISLGSSMQVALFVAPVLIFLSLALGNPMSLIFNAIELAALVVAVALAALISVDGESNWLEGAQLLVLYIILGIAFFMFPTT
ncbi:MAG: calcium/proton exchanger [Chloroflexi bacterium]|nr:calcium/proton exchanger [Chloroflexota bacterium]